MSAALAFANEHSVAFVGTLYALLNLINGLISNPDAKSIVGKMIDALAFLTRGDADGTLKSPLTRSRKVLLPAIPAVTVEASDVSQR